MTHEKALTLRVGMYVSTRHEDHRNARRITKTWVNAEGTIVRIRINSMYGDAWLSPADWEVVKNPWRKKT